MGDQPIEAPKSEKSLAVTLVLCIFLGTLGIHRLYAGKIGTGIVQMVMDVVFGILLATTMIAALAADIGSAVSVGAAAWVLLSALGLWVFVDLIRIVIGRFPDRAGRPIK